MQQERKWLEARAKDVLDTRKSSRIRAFPVYRGVSLLQALEIFANTNIQRIPVLNRRHRVVGMVTQSMAISLLTQNLNLLGPLKDLKVSEILPHLKKEVLSVREDQKAIEAMNKIVKENVSGLAVVDGNGLLVDTISVRDFRGIGNDAAKFKRLYLTVAQYKNELRKEFTTQTPKEVLYVTPNDSFARVIELMDDGNIHRVFVAEQAGDKVKPSAIISQGDVLRFLVIKTGLPVVPQDEDDKDKGDTVMGTPSSSSSGLGSAAEPMDTGTPRGRSDSQDTTMDTGR
jgi:CBS domain-containing protein